MSYRKRLIVRIIHIAQGLPFYYLLLGGLGVISLPLTYLLAPHIGSLPFHVSLCLSTLFFMSAIWHLFILTICVLAHVAEALLRYGQHLKK